MRLRGRERRGRVNEPISYGGRGGRRRIMKLNTIIQGDCLEVMKNIPDKSVDLVIADPPYGVNYDGGVTNDIKREKLVNDDTADLYQKIYPEIYRILKDDGTAYIFYASGYEKEVFPIPLFSQYEVLIRFKTNATFGAANARYKQDYEPILYLRKKGGSKWRGNTKQRMVWFEKRNPKNIFHPTQKPIDVISRMILNSTDENDIILDPFLGSGTTAVACKQLNRNYIGIELSGEYCDIAKQRLAQEQLF